MSSLSLAKTFTAVVKAHVIVADVGALLPDAAAQREAAIKITSSQDTMYKSGQCEAALLAKLNAVGLAPCLRPVERSRRLLSAESTPTLYHASRFYRAHEIILELPHDSSPDTWSMGYTLIELYTGGILFPD
ncbi:hypothetical protein DL96DRAFT_1710769 [Flagelloscypha sp. PMI_526]|nr:hypothetical protein DL96DRAFT_1710769 [Flagelloscypha sp. PMI_526]